MEKGAKSNWKADGPCDDLKGSNLILLLLP